MLYAFIDESERDESFYFLGAVVVNESQLENLVLGFDILVAEYSANFQQLNPEEELHGSAIMRAADSPWRDLPLKVRADIYRKALKILEQTGAKCFVEGIDRQKHLSKPYDHHFDPREMAFSYLLERVNSVCSNNEPSIEVIADEHHTWEQSRSNFARYQITGTFGYRSSRLSNIVPPIHFKKSHSERGLQASDLVTYLFNRLMTVKERNSKGQALKELLWSEVEPATLWPRGRTRIWP